MKCNGNRWKNESWIKGRIIHQTNMIMIKCAHTHIHHLLHKPKVANPPHRRWTLSSSACHSFQKGWKQTVMWWTLWACVTSTVKPAFWKYSYSKYTTLKLLGWMFQKIETENQADVKPPFIPRVQVVRKRDSLKPGEKMSMVPETYCQRGHGQPWDPSILLFHIHSLSKSQNYFRLSGFP